jgi:hypothetical protein
MGLTRLDGVRIFPLGLLASARTPLLSAAVNEARALSILADISALMTAAAPRERRAVVGSWLK